MVDRVKTMVRFRSVATESAIFSERFRASRGMLGSLVPGCRRKMGMVNSSELSKTGHLTTTVVELGNTLLLLWLTAARY